MLYRIFMSVADQERISKLEERLLKLEMLLALQSETLNDIAEDKSNLKGFLNTFTHKILQLKSKETNNDSSI